jgi:hypothetical protein
METEGGKMKITKEILIQLDVGPIESEKQMPYVFAFVVGEGGYVPELYKENTRYTVRVQVPCEVKGQSAIELEAQIISKEEAK